MNEELLSQVGFGDERIYSWVYTQHQTRPEHAYKQAFRLDITPEVIALVELVIAAERERACRIVTGLCISDNNAREINEKIRSGP
jgi:hypothetical protein